MDSSSSQNESNRLDVKELTAKVCLGRNLYFRWEMGRNCKKILWIVLTVSEALLLPGYFKKFFLVNFFNPRTIVEQFIDCIERCHNNFVAGV